MKTKDVFVVAALAIAVLGCQACSDPSTGQVSGQVGVPEVDVEDVADVDAPVGTDTDGGVDAADAADAVTAADAVADAGDATGSADSVCAKDLPMPGEPCSKIGEVRCTNVGAKPKFVNIARCLRPNMVVCTQSPNGGPASWVLQACPAPGKDCYTWQGFVCATGKSGDQCVPVTLPMTDANLAPASPLAQNADICEGHEGDELCYGSTTPNRCTTLDKLPADVVAEIKRVMGPCASYLSDVPYFYPSELCSLDYIDCKTVPGTPEHLPSTAPYSLNKCYVDPATGKPRCAKTCAEVGAIEVW